MNDTNQHYITKAHLDKFVHSDSAQNVLYPYRRGGSACKPRGTRQLGSAINFYRQRDSGGLTDKLDEARTQSEILLFSSGKRTPSSVSKCVFDDAFIPSQQDRLHLAAAAAFLWCGSPVQIHNTAMVSLLHAQMALLNRLNTQEAAKLYRERYGEDAEAKLAEHRQAILQGKLIMDVDGGKENWKQLGFSSFQIEEQVIQLLLGMKMTIVDCHYRSFFLTSDNPVVRTFGSPPHQFDDEVWFPISYKRGVLWHWRNMGGPRTRLGHSQSRAINRRAIKFSYKYVYSPLPQDWIETAAKSETFDPLFGHYESLEKVLELAEPAIREDGQVIGEIIDLVAAAKCGGRHDVLGL